MPDTPLIYTTKGNLPIADLEYSTAWEEIPGKCTKLIETYRLDGEIVRQSAHVLAREPLIAEAVSANLN